ncbi:MAG: hypothetical protein E6L04_01655 [Thaumarchaeota archaeon]|nr:MAG: hypothetical protein E6K97_10780 [Nitrososphaerota archaeon]TLX88022.1 MAG: hypothetical protein E6L04_01655 [Nitrososphaerota archaeon]
MKRPEPTIKAIAYSQDKLKFIGQKLANPSLSEYQKREYIRRFVGGECTMCLVNALCVMKSQPRWHVMTWVKFFLLKDTVTNV